MIVQVYGGGFFNLPTQEIENNSIDICFRNGGKGRYREIGRTIRGGKKVVIICYSEEIPLHISNALVAIPCDPESV